MNGICRVHSSVAVNLPTVATYDWKLKDPDGNVVLDDMAVPDNGTAFTKETHDNAADLDGLYTMEFIIPSSQTIGALDILTILKIRNR